MNTQEILSAYLECAAWAEGLNGDFTKAAISQATADVEKFAAKNEVDIIQFMQQNDVEFSQVGHSLYLSRNGHGAGFFDFWGEGADNLQEAARVFGQSTAIKSCRYISFI